MSTILLQVDLAIPSEWWGAIAAVLAFVIGAGTVGRWLAKKVRAGNLAETKENVKAILSQEFTQNYATKKELNGWRASLEKEVNGFRHSMEKSIEGACATAKGSLRVAQIANTQADEALEKAQRVEIMFDEFRRGIAEDMKVSIQQMTALQRGQGESLAKTAGLLERLTEQVDELSRRL